MVDETTVVAEFTQQLVGAILEGLVLTNVLSKEAASSLVDDCLDHLLAHYPEHERLLRGLAGTLSAQIALGKVEFDRQMRKPPS